MGQYSRDGHIYEHNISLIASSHHTSIVSPATPPPATISPVTPAGPTNAALPPTPAVGAVNGDASAGANGIGGALGARSACAKGVEGAVQKVGSDGAGGSVVGSGGPSVGGAGKKGGIHQLVMEQQMLKKEQISLETTRKQWHQGHTFETCCLVVLREHPTGQRPLAAIQGNASV